MDVFNTQNTISLDRFHKLMESKMNQDVENQAGGYIADRVADLEAELLEQCRLHGIGSEREAKQLTEITELREAVRELRGALLPFSEEPTSYMDNYACHKGITTKEKCGRCSLAIIAFNALAKTEKWGV